MGGRPLLAWSLDALAESGSISEVVVAAPPGLEDEVASVARAATVVSGGKSRSESVALALDQVGTDLVAVHDAARPLTRPAVFDAVVAELAGDPGAAGVIAAARVADTLKRALAGRVIETVPRSELWAVQTPQVFRTERLREALGIDPEALATATDDASLVEAAGGVVRLYEVHDPNPKLTTAADLALIESLLAA